MSDWCKAVRGSKSKAGAGKEEGDRGDDGETTVRAEREAAKETSDSTVMDGQEDGTDRGPDPGPESDLKPTWTSEGNAGTRSDSEDSHGTRRVSERTAAVEPECWGALDPGLGGIGTKPDPGDGSEFWF